MARTVLAAYFTPVPLPAVSPAPGPSSRAGRADLQPRGPLVTYRADLRHHYVFVRGGNPELGNAVDMTVEV